MATQRFDITGMTCAACSSRVEKATSAVPGVERAVVNLLKNSMDVTYDGAPATIAAIGDFSGDGIDDIVVWQESTGYMYAWENGDADTKRWVGALDQSGWEIAAVGDYNGDGKEDILLREQASGWGGLGYWGAGYAVNWTDMKTRIETDTRISGSKFDIIA